MEQATFTAKRCDFSARQCPNTYSQNWL